MSRVSHFHRKQRRGSSFKLIVLVILDGIPSIPSGNYVMVRSPSGDNDAFVFFAVHELNDMFLLITEQEIPKK